MAEEKALWKGLRNSKQQFGPQEGCGGPHKELLGQKYHRGQKVAEAGGAQVGRDGYGAAPSLPPNKRGVEGVAAALKAAELASGDQYLNELKLMHVEAGHPIEAWLMRVLALCKKSLTRNRGPVKRAPEVTLESIPWTAWSLRGGHKVLLATLAFAWGVAWMLRVIELSRVKWEAAVQGGPTGPRSG